MRCQTQKIDGFSGHSDFNQILGFVSRVRPKRVLVNHGEKSKSDNVASAIYSRLKIRSEVYQITEKLSGYDSCYICFHSLFSHVWVIKIRTERIGNKI